MSTWMSAVAGVCASVGASSLKYYSSHNLTPLVQVGLLIVFIVANVMVWWLQLRALSSNSTVNAVVAFTGANFASAAILGALIHDEVGWWRTTVGCGLVLAGVFTIAWRPGGTAKNNKTD